MSNELYRIKPLKWVEEDFRTQSADFYTVFLSSANRWKCYFNGRSIGSSETVEGVKEICRQHRHDLLMQQLEPANARP